eukprot:230606-Prorocentrum_minimum.AAC.1
MGTQFSRLSQRHVDRLLDAMHMITCKEGETICGPVRRPPPSKSGNLKDYKLAFGACQRIVASSRQAGPLKTLPPRPGQSHRAGVFIFI